MYFEKSVVSPHARFSKSGSHGGSIALLSALTSLSFLDLSGCVLSHSNNVKVNPESGRVSQTQTEKKSHSSISPEQIAELQYVEEKLDRLLFDGAHHLSEARTYLQELPATSREYLQRLYSELLTSAIPRSPSEHYRFQRTFWILSTLSPELVSPDLEVQAHALRNVFIQDLLQQLELCTGSSHEQVSIINDYVTNLHAILPFVTFHERIALEMVFRDVDAWVCSIPPGVIVNFLRDTNTLSQATLSNRRALDQNRLEFVAEETPPRSAGRTNSATALLNLRQILSREQGWRLDQRHWIFSHAITSDLFQDWVLEVSQVSLGERITMRLLEKPDCFVRFSIKEFTDLCSQSLLSPELDVAFINDVLESNDQVRGELLRFDLPHEGRLVYRRIFSNYLDLPGRNALFYSMLLRRAMELRYPNLDCPPIVIMDNFENEIARPVSEGLEIGSTEVISFFCHGSTKALNFAQPVGNEQLISLARNHQRGLLVVHTMACYGGGLETFLKGAISAEPSLGPRIALFTESDGNAPNEMPYRDGRGGGTRYMQHLIEALLDPEIRTFGSAHHRADLATQLEPDVVCDAKALVEGVLYP